MATHTVQTIVTDGAVRINTSASVTPSASTNLEETIADAASDLLVALTIESTSLTSFIMTADQDLTVKTNSSGAPQETFALKANKPVVWLTGMANTPIAGDVTALYVSNSSGSSATLKVLAGWDATP